jgi:hypothetical protein
MMTPDDKRSIRILKRAIKKAGNRKRRNHFKRALNDESREEFAFGRDSSAALNGNDHDATRRHPKRE